MMANPGWLPPTSYVYTAADAEYDRSQVRWPGDGLDGGFARPELEPLATRLERARRTNVCRWMTQEMLTEFANAQRWPLLWVGDVWIKGIHVDFVVLTWKGAFLIWSVDMRWTPRQVAMVKPARDQVQRELGDAWPGQVEMMFHSPREPTGWHRHILIDEQLPEPVEIVTCGGRIDEVLVYWKPAGGVGLDPEWITWLTEASQARWWRSSEGRAPAPEIPVDERA